MSDTTTAFRALVAVANSLRQALRDLNEYGDEVHRSIATQGNGCAYGEVHDGLVALLRELYPDDGIENRAGKILDAMYADDLSVSVEEAANLIEREHELAGIDEFDVTAANGTPFRVVFLPKGLSRSRPQANKYVKDDKPRAEFYDTRYDHTPDGQFICEYYVDTLLAGTDDTVQGTFVLFGGTPAWHIDGETMLEIRRWLRSFSD